MSGNGILMYTSPEGTLENAVMEVVRLSCRPGFGDQFAEAIRRGMGAHAKDPGCLEAYFQRREEDPDEFLLNITWASIEAHEAWRASALRTQWRSEIDELLEGSTEVLGHFRRVADVK